MDKRFILAIVLTVLVMLFFTFLQSKQIADYRKNHPEEFAQQQDGEASSETIGGATKTRPTPEMTISEADTVVEATGETKTIQVPNNLVASGANSGETHDIRTSVANIIISSTGGSLQSVSLPGYLEHVPDSESFKCQNGQLFKDGQEVVPGDFDRFDRLTGEAIKAWLAAVGTSNKELITQAQQQLQYYQTHRELAAIESWHARVDPLRQDLEKAESDQNQTAIQQAQDQLNEAEALEMLPFRSGYDQPLTLSLMRKQQSLFSDAGFLYETAGPTQEGTSTKVTFSAVQGKIGIQKAFTFYDDYHGDLEITVSNNGTEMLDADFGDLQISWDGGLGRYLSTGLRLPEVIYVDGVRFLTPDALYKLFQDNKISEKSSVNMAMVQSKYFMAALIPEGESVFRPVLPDETGIQARKKMKNSPAYDMGIRVPIRQLKPGEAQTIRYTLFMGPKKEEALAPVVEMVNPEKIVFQRTYLLDWIRMTWICPLLLSCLKAFNAFTGNFGVAIIILVVIVKSLLYPITLKQHKNQRKMQAIQPQLKALREKYKDNPMEAHKKSSELMRKHGVKMSGGCLPALVQMPIFVGLYFTLYYSIELRGAPFFGWIKDLSEPDSLFHICLGTSLFNLRVLPILNAFITFLSMKQTPVADPQQAKMFTFMPLIFLFIFWNFPSGLVLYWTLQGLIQFVTILLMEHVHFRDEKGGKQHA